MTLKRGSGILLHITSLPSHNGIGNLGPGACAFVDFLDTSGQSYWQVLPLNPPSPGDGNSPYSSSSAFAGNTLLISPEHLIRDGFLHRQNIPPASKFPLDKIDFGTALEFNERILDCAYGNFKSGRDREAYERFCVEASYWLDDFALFKALKSHFGNSSWSDWPAEIRDRHQPAMERYSIELSERIEKQKLFQFLFYSQWNEIKKYANHKGIEIIGDLPIYMSYQSADAWAHPEIFKLGPDKKPQFVAGVPPDYFSETGQLWGNPVYDWRRLEEFGFDWWVKRIDHNLKLYDMLRIDHFRGLVAYWEIPAGEKTAIRGEWVSAPGDRLFARLRELYPSLPIIAEDLGIITTDVREFIDRLGIPSMKVLLFAFGEGLPDSPYAPHNYIKNCVVYTGTHDNSTARGWFEKEASAAERASLNEYAGQAVTPENVNLILVRMALMSVADIALIPMQDILGLGAESRMNIPSTASGNWEWRLRPDALTPDAAAGLRSLTRIYGRLRPARHLA
jgi:4-alpha-glucanotransferase